MNARRFRAAVLALIVLVLAGCSYRGAYESMQARQRTKCMERPPSQIEACLEAANQSYDAYQRERRRAGDAPVSTGPA